MARTLFFKLSYLVSVLTLAPGITLGASFMGLGDLEGGTTFSTAYGVSDDGSVIVGSSHSPLGIQGVYWTQYQGLTSIGHANFPYSQSELYAISSDGTIAAGWGSSGLGTEALRFNRASGRSSFVHEDTGPIYNKSARGISGDGTTIIGYGPGENGGFRWTSSTGFTKLLDHRGLDSSVVHATSGDGSVVVGRARNGKYFEPTYWDEDGNPISLGWLSGAFSSSWSFGTAQDVSHDGSFIVGQAFSEPGHFEAFLWDTEGGMQGLGTLDTHNSSSSASAVSDDGAKVVGTSKVGTTDIAFLWDKDTGIHALIDVLIEQGLEDDIQGWTLTHAYDISADGQFLVGRGINAQGMTEGFFVALDSRNESTSVHLPSPFLLLTLGLVLTARSHKRY